MQRGVVYALLAAVLFGASTPFAKALVGQAAPVVLAGLLYLGSGLGLLALYVLRGWLKRRSGDAPAALTRADLPWLAGAVAAGGVAGPVLLMFGLAVTPASSAALLLNLEGVLTALLAWCVFKEGFDRRIAAGMVLIAVAGVLLSWDQKPALGLPWGALAIAAACLCWAVDNNLTRKVSASDALQIAGLKGLVAGSVNLAIAVALQMPLPAAGVAFGAALLGFLGYGLSLVLFVLALRHVGTARTGAYFSAAPFAGALCAIVVFGEVPAPVFWLAAVLMGAGIYLHVSEVHDHEHRHEPLSHTHRHSHDEHHQHTHDASWDGSEPHTHAHDHAALVHRHPHYPDIHHRHRH